MASVTLEKSQAKRALQGHEMAFALDVARVAGGIMREKFILGMERKLKLDRTVVTEADIRINKMLLSSVKSDFPTHDVLAEEESDMSKKSSLVWVCDPIDGTMSFCRGIPTCVFSLALVNEGVPILGVVYDPFMDRMFTAIADEGAFVSKQGQYSQSQKISVSKDKTLKGTAVGHVFWNSSNWDILGLWNKLQRDGSSPVMLGSITYMGAMVACGEFSGNIHPATSAHDSAALKVIVEEAGGKVTDLFGEDQRYDKLLKGGVMSNGLVHDELLALIRDHLNRDASAKSAYER
jgi:fructose-1,6-bisphosphatase/inositol monophosphatase family enzyme